MRESIALNGTSVDSEKASITRGELPKPQPLEPAFSLYLDLLRCLAASAVVLGHMRALGIGMDWLFLAYFEHEAVMIFFVLSGFIICHSTLSRQRSFREYLVARIARLYSVTIPALFVCFGMALLYRYSVLSLEVIPEYSVDSGLVDFVASLFFLVQSEWFVDWFGTIPFNFPFWSLCFEFWYYIAFGVVIYLRGPLRIVLLLACAAFAGPRVILLAPIWALGVIYCIYISKVRCDKKISALLFLASLLIILAIKIFDIDSVTAQYVIQNVPGAWQLQDSSRFLTDYLLALAVLFNFIFVRQNLHLIEGILKRAKQPIQFLSNYSFTLYMFHLPCLVFIDTFTVDNSVSIPGQLGLFAMTLVICFVISLATERQLKAWTRFVGMLIPGRR